MLSLIVKKNRWVDENGKLTNRCDNTQRNIILVSNFNPTLFRHSGVKGFPEFPTYSRSLANSRHLRSPPGCPKARSRILFWDFDADHGVNQHTDDILYTDPD
jgi:hypothetical protein